MLIQCATNADTKDNSKSHPWSNELFGFNGRKAYRIVDGAVGRNGVSGQGTWTAGGVAEASLPGIKMKDDEGTLLEFPLMLGVHQVGIGVAVGTEPEAFRALNPDALAQVIGQGHLTDEAGTGGLWLYVVLGQAFNGTLVTTRQDTVSAVRGILPGP